MKPVTPSATASLFPPTSVAITGTPEDIASRREFDRPSVSEVDIHIHGGKCPFRTFHARQASGIRSEPRFLNRAPDGVHFSTIFPSQQEAGPGVNRMNESGNPHEIHMPLIRQ